MELLSLERCGTRSVVQETRHIEVESPSSVQKVCKTCSGVEFAQKVSAAIHVYTSIVLSEMTKQTES